jgi:Flp pilus assembly pilin Flp
VLAVVLAVAVLAAVLTLVGWLTLAWMRHREYV